MFACYMISIIEHDVFNLVKHSEIIHYNAMLIMRHRSAIISLYSEVYQA